MSETKRQGNIYFTNYTCDDCDQKSNLDCILVKATSVITEYPPAHVYERPKYTPVYIYECPNCKKEYKLDKNYPFVTYE